MEVAKREREKNEQKAEYCEQVDQEMKEAREKFLLERSNMNKERERLEVDATLHKQQEKEKLDQALRELDLKLYLARDRNEITINNEKARITVEQNKAKEIKIKVSNESAKLRQDAEGEI